MGILSKQRSKNFCMKLDCTLVQKVTEDFKTNREKFNKN